MAVLKKQTYTATHHPSTHTASIVSCLSVLPFCVFTFNQEQIYQKSNSKKKKRLTDPQEAIKADGHPVAQQLLYYGLSASQQQFGLCVAVLLHQIFEQNFHHLRQVR